MNDTIQIANDTLKAAISIINSAAHEPDSSEMWSALCVIGIFVVIAATVAYIVRSVIKSLETAKIRSCQHEKNMHELNRVKEERKRLLDFCYDMAKKKESETRDVVKEPEKEIQKLLHDNVYNTLGAVLNKSDNKPSKGDDGKNTEATLVCSHSKSISLDQIRQECWEIIKKINGVDIEKDS